MSLAVLAWTAAQACAAAVATALLLRASSQSDSLVKNGYRWLAATACCWGIGGIAQQAFGGLIGGPAPLRAADLVSLAALPALVIGLATLAFGLAEPDSGPAEPGTPPHDAHGPASIGPGPARQAYGIVVDSGLLVMALFVIGWVTLFGPDYNGADVGPAAFALDLIRPTADLAAVGMLLAFAVRFVRVTLLPMLALAAMTFGDSLAVGARISGASAGAGSHLAWFAGLCLLAAAPAAARSGLRQHRSQQIPGSAGSWSSPATLIALSAAAAAALVVIGFSLGGGSVASPALAVAGAAVVLVLVIRLIGLARQASVVAATAHESDRMFRALAGTTSDAVVVCDPAGLVRYVSPAIAAYGYAPFQLIGVRLADLVHPQDRLRSIRAAIAVLRASGRGDGRPGGHPRYEGNVRPDGADDAGTTLTAAFSGRVRSADGSWRHVECVLSCYRQAGLPPRLLVSARDVSDRVALRRQLTHLTFHDGLTGLPNRAFIEERVKDLLGQGEPDPGDRPARAKRDEPALGESDQAPLAGTADDQPPVVTGAILVDLDGYTAVNDLIGHGGGDLVLAQAGRRLRAAAPPQATVARWGGDEFAILVAGADSAQDILDLAERLAGRIAAEPFSAAGKDFPLTASVGVALTPVSSAENLLNNADVAMSRAKEGGGGRVEVFAAQMHADVLRRLELAAGLQQAIIGHQLEVEYLPVIELATARVTAVEALVRWSRDGQTIAPAEFLEVAEDCGLIVPLGDLVLREACRQVAAWHRAGSDIGLCVNVSIRQVSTPGFAASVLAALDDACLTPDVLTLEVTERMLIDSTGAAIAELAGLRRKGVRLAIDNFGTGYASLSYLPQLSVDIIKIDPSFVAGLGIDPTLTLLTKTVMQVGHDLDIEVVAEGIERPEQREQLRGMGCNLGQGFGVARPMSPPGIAVILAQQAASDVPAGQQASASACSPAG